MRPPKELGRCNGFLAAGIADAEIVILSGCGNFSIRK